jgi:hypothetical protein
LGENNRMRDKSTMSTRGQTTNARERHTACY